MNARKFALWFGIAYLGAGILGFVPAALRPMPDSGLAITAFSGLLLGLFPVNFLHSLVHIAAGAWGIAGSRSMGGARAWSKTMAVVFALVTLMGLVPATNTVFGLMPIHGHDIWLHGLFAVLAAYFGWRGTAEPLAKAAQ